MRLARHPQLDALCGEFLLGTLQGAARRRFERALRDEPLVALRLRHWQRLFAVRYAETISVTPSSAGWRRLVDELQLRRLQPRWWQRVGFWRGWAIGATAALLLALGLNLVPPREPALVDIARLSGQAQPATVVAAASADYRTLRLRATRPVVAGPTQSYELWVIPAGGGAPISMAVLGQLDARLQLAPAQAEQIRRGATLAISVEPAGGSPTGAPTGPVILTGEVSI